MPGEPKGREVLEGDCARGGGPRAGGGLDGVGTELSVWLRVGGAWRGGGGSV